MQAVRSSEQRLEAAANQRRYAQEQYESERRRFESGLSTVFLVLDRQTSFVTAQALELRAARRSQSGDRPARTRDRRDARVARGEAAVVEQSARGQSAKGPGTNPMWLGEHAAQHRLPRRGVGRAGARRPCALRVHHARRRAGGPELGDDSQEARGLPRGVRRLRSGKGRALHAGARRTLLQRSRHRPQPPEDREHGHQRQGVSGGPEGVRELRCLRLAVRRRRTARRTAAAR